jgi:hypothetical protein
MHRNRTRFVSAALAVVTAFGATACATRRGTGAAVGAGSGAVVGGVIGSKSGSCGKGALIGAGAGALLGYVIANESDPARDRPRTVGAPPPPPPRYEAGDPNVAKKDEATREFQTAMAARDAVTTEYHLRRSLDAYPTPAAYNNLGLVLLNGGDKTGARENFRRALQLDPAYEPALQNLEKLGATP